MTVLSEHSIRKHMEQGLLVLNGDAAQATGAGYRFRPQLVIPGGGAEHIYLEEALPEEEAPGDRAGRPEDISVRQSYVVGPRSLVWVRMLETVKLPNDVCAFWWQTNSLSRKGLMLVNMSMVDPGYEGPLACLFVNFGRSEVRLSAGMTMARLVFHQVDADAEPYPVSFRTQEYDNGLADDALAGSSSFLSLDDYRVEFQSARREALRDFQDSIETATEAAIDKVKSPLNAVKSIGVAAFGFVLLLTALKFVPWLEGLWPQRFEDTVQSSVETALQNSDLVERIMKLEAQLQDTQDGN